MILTSTLQLCDNFNYNKTLIYFQMDSFEDNTAVLDVKTNFQMLLHTVGKKAKWLSHYVKSRCYRIDITIIIFLLT